MINQISRGLQSACAVTYVKQCIVSMEFQITSTYQQQSLQMQTRKHKISVATIINDETNSDTSLEEYEELPTKS